MPKRFNHNVVLFAMHLLLSNCIILYRIICWWHNTIVSWDKILFISVLINIVSYKTIIQFSRTFLYNTLLYHDIIRDCVIPHSIQYFEKKCLSMITRANCGSSCKAIVTIHDCGCWLNNPWNRSPHKNAVPIKRKCHLVILI